MKKVLTKLTETGASEETIKEFKTNAPAGVKKILANYDNYDVLMGQSTDGDAMYVPRLVNGLVRSLTCLARHVLIDFREDGVTPYATLWKHGLVEMKV
jgi:hypothetical protein